MRAWFPQVPGTAGATGATGPTGPTGPAGLGVADSIVFSPGGTAGGNVVTTEAALAAATAAVKGAAYTIFFDLSHVAGAYSFTTVGALALALGGTWTDNGLLYAITFNAGTTLPAPPRKIEGTLQVAVAQSVALCTVAVSGTTELANAAGVTTSAAGAFIKSTAGEWAVYLNDTATIAGGSNTERALQTAGGQIGLVVADNGGVAAFAADSGCVMTVVTPDTAGVQGSTDATLYTIAECDGLYVDIVGGAVAGIPPLNFSGKFLDDATTGKKYWSNGTAFLQLGTIVAAYASRPVAGLAGREFVANDPGIVSFVDDGSAWRPMVGGWMGTEAAPAGSTAGYTFTNTGGGATLTGAMGVARLRRTNASADNLVMAGQAWTTAKTCIVCLAGYFVPSAGGLDGEYGIYVRNPTTGQILTLSVGLGNQANNNTLQGNIYTNPTTFGSRFENPITYNIGTGAPIWLKVNDDGTNFNFFFSIDGVTYEAFGTVATAAGFTEAGFLINPHAATIACDCYSFFIG